MASGEMSPVEYTGFLTDSFIQLARASEDGSLLYAFMDWRHTGEILEAGEAAYDRLINVCCWVKSNGGMGSLYRSRHELVFVFKKGSASSSPSISMSMLASNALGMEIFQAPKRGPSVSARSATMVL